MKDTREIEVHAMHKGGPRFIVRYNCCFCLLLFLYKRNTSSCDAQGRAALLFDTDFVSIYCDLPKIKDTRGIQVHAMHKNGPQFYCSIPFLFLFIVIYRKSKILEEYKFMRCTRTDRVFIVRYRFCFFVLWFAENQKYQRNTSSCDAQERPAFLLFDTFFVFVYCDLPKMKDTRGTQVHAMHRDGPRFYCSIPFLFCFVFLFRVFDFCFVFVSVLNRTCLFKTETKKFQCTSWN